MIEMEDLKRGVKKYATPLYVYDLDAVEETLTAFRLKFWDTADLCFAMKANPFLTGKMEKYVDRIEVCSMGEYRICRVLGIAPEKLLISGVLKQKEDILEILEECGGTCAYTVESLNQFYCLANWCEERCEVVHVYMRLTSGNQFGMDEETLAQVIKESEKFPFLKIRGIHYFSGTQKRSTEKIKKELIHQQHLVRWWGKSGAKKILWIESVWKKYAGISMVTKLPKRLGVKARKKLICLRESVPEYKNLLVAKVTAHAEKGKIVLLDPAYDGDNVGDQIIMESCLSQFPSDLLARELKHVPTHREPTEKEQRELSSAETKILCGTNALSGKMRSYGLWHMNANVGIYKNTILMGVGFDSNSNEFDVYTKLLFRTILSPKHIHSVRDKFSEAMLKNMGIRNVIYTGCPTMWNITPELCSRIPKAKADKVVCTLTDYNRNLIADQALLNILSECYKRVFLWPQGIEDKEYFEQVKLNNNVEIVSEGLEKYDEILKLKSIDYVGTRLHAGIRALTREHRTIIISIDNRAKNISADTGLPIIERGDIMSLLYPKINSEFVTKIQMPIDNINRWKNQIHEF